MKFIIAIILVVSAAVLPAVPVQAQAPDTIQLQNISRSCQQQQVNLRGLQKRDTILRINRGRLYDMNQRQMAAFAARLQANNVAAPAVLQLDTQFRTLFLQFKADYDIYAGLLEQAIGVDCAAKPAEFYGLLLQAGSARMQVAKDVAALKEVNGKYIAELVRLRDTLYPN